MSRHPVLAIFVVALAVRFIAVLFIQNVLGTSGFGVSDDTTYSYMAEQVVRGASDEWGAYTRELYNSTATFTLPLTLIYLVFGSVTVGGPLLAACFGALTAAFTTRTALEVLPPGWSLAAGLSIAWFPSQVLWSSFTLKDSAVWATLAALGVVVAIGNRTSRWRLVAAGAGTALILLLLGHLRAHTLVAACWSVLLACLFSDRTARVPRIAGATAIVIAVPWLLGLGPGGWSLAVNQDLEYRRTANAVGAATAFVSPPEPPAAAADVVAAAQSGADRVAEELRRQQVHARKLAAAVTARPDAGASDKGNAQAASGDASGQDASAVARARRELAAVRRRIAVLKKRREDLLERVRQLETQTPQVDDQLLSEQEEGLTDPTLRHLPKGLSVMLLEPYPWRDTDNPRVDLARLESLVWYPLLAFALLGLFDLARSPRYRRVLMYPVLVGGAVLLIYALAEGNFGTAYRHRGEFVWVVAVLAATGAHALFHRIAPHRNIPHDERAPARMSREDR